MRDRRHPLSIAFRRHRATFRVSKQRSIGHRHLSFPLALARGKVRSLSAEAETGTFARYPPHAADAALAICTQRFKVKGARSGKAADYLTNRRFHAVTTLHADRCIARQLCSATNGGRVETRVTGAGGGGHRRPPGLRACAGTRAAACRETAIPESLSEAILCAVDVLRRHTAVREMPNPRGTYADGSPRRRRRHATDRSVTRHVTFYPLVTL